MWDVHPWRAPRSLERLDKLEAMLAQVRLEGDQESGVLHRSDNDYAFDDTIPLSIAGVVQEWRGDEDFEARISFEAILNDQRGLLLDHEKLVGHLLTSHGYRRRWRRLFAGHDGLCLRHATLIARWH